MASRRQRPPLHDDEDQPQPQGQGRAGRTQGRTQGRAQRHQTRPASAPSRPAWEWELGPRMRHPFAGTLRLRRRELLGRPAVLVPLALQLVVLAGVGLLAAAGRDPLGAHGDLVLAGLRATAVPGGLLFAVLVAAAVGAEFGWSTERMLLARDPRRSRFAALQFALTLGVALGWWALQSLLVIVGGDLEQRLIGPARGLPLTAAPERAALLAALVASVVYGLLGAAGALCFRGALAGVMAVLTYAAFGELVLAPQSNALNGWTVATATLRLSSAPGIAPAPGVAATIPQHRAVEALVAAATSALLVGFLAYADREIRG